MLGLIFLFVFLFLQEYDFSVPLPLYYNDGDVIKLVCVLPSGYQFQSWTHARGGSISVSYGRYVLLKEEKNQLASLFNNSQCLRV